MEFLVKMICSGAWCQFVVVKNNEAVERSEFFLEPSEEHPIPEWAEFFRHRHAVETGLLQRLHSQSAAERQHANRYEWSDREQQATTESYLAHKLYETLDTPNSHIQSHYKPDTHHPDIVLQVSTGEEMAVEISEIVNKESITLQIQIDRAIDNGDEKQYSCLVNKYAKALHCWNAQTFQEAIQERINTKEDIYSSRTADELNDYARIILLLHTDEPHLRASSVDLLLEEIGGFEWSYFDDVFLICSHNGPSVVRTIPRKPMIESEEE